MKNEPNFSPIAVTVGQAGRLLGLGRSKVYEMLQKGELQSRTVGRRRLVSMASVHAIMSQSVDGGRDARKLIPINRRAEPGFYEAAYPGKPCFLVLPDEGRGPAAIQLDGSEKRRAFTFVELGAKTIGKGYRIAGISITVAQGEKPLPPGECPIGGVMVEDDGMIIQAVNETGMYVLVVLTPGLGAFGGVKLRREAAHRWQLIDNRFGAEKVLFTSHPRPGGTAPIPEVD